MRRSVLVTFSVAITLVFGAGSAAAAAPFRLPLDPVHDVQAAGVVCPFAVSVDSVKINETLTVLANGRVFITGASVERVTHLDNGKSVVLVNAAGGDQDVVRPEDQVAIARRAREANAFVDQT